MAAETLAGLFNEQPAARALFDRGYGYAVFAIRQASLGLTAGYGYGVAVGGEVRERIYMKAATGGVEIGKGAAGFKSRWVAIFADAQAFRVFVEQGLDASAEASGAISPRWRRSPRCRSRSSSPCSGNPATACSGSRRRKS